MSAAKFLFVGNRRFVLEEMLRRNLDMSVVVVEQSHLHNDIKTNAVPGIDQFRTIGSKKEILDIIEQGGFDILVANGCPFILPISQLEKKIYVNVHPSPLPELRGCDPVIGSVLFRRDSGATCHLMDDGIDTGPIISQVRIPYTSDLDVTTLYQLSFIAEKRAFSAALDVEFIPKYAHDSPKSYSYYTRSLRDRIIDFKKCNEDIISTVRAFCNRRAGCIFHVEGLEYKVYNAQIMSNSFLEEYASGFDDGVVVLSYEDSIIFKKEFQVIRFSGIEGKSRIEPGDIIFESEYK